MCDGAVRKTNGLMREGRKVELKEGHYKEKKPRKVVQLNAKFKIQTCQNSHDVKLTSTRNVGTK